MNLINDPWIPVRRKSGEHCLLAPWQITEHRGTTEEVAAVSSPRADFDGALMQFLIGLLQTTMAPADHDEWVELLEDPPSAEKLQGAFAQKSGAFETEAGIGSGSFLQDYGPWSEPVKTWDVSRMLIDFPGESTEKRNRDHFVKRDAIKRMWCPACAIAALLTLQINAPGGGRGHRAGMRARKRGNMPGGGAFTTLVVNDTPNSGLAPVLWTNLWLNVLDEEYAKNIIPEGWDKTRDSDIFPWLAPTRDSAPPRKQEMHPADAHPYQAYWAMPRRIRVSWDKKRPGRCGLCGGESDALVEHYQTKTHGVFYEGQWNHPLSPYAKDNETGATNAKHLDSDGVSYQHWLDWTSGAPLSLPSLTVSRYQTMLAKQHEVSEQLVVHAFGYDMDKQKPAKPRCWYEATMPLYAIDEEHRPAFGEQAQRLISSATIVAKAVRSCIKEAWSKRPKDIKGDTDFLKNLFFKDTESKFYRMVEDLLGALKAGERAEKVMKTWHSTLIRSAYDLFDFWSENGYFAHSDPKRIVKARDKLAKTLHGTNLRAKLGLPPKS